MTYNINCVILIIGGLSNGKPQTTRITQSFSSKHTGIDLSLKNASVIANYDGIVQTVVKNVKGKTNFANRGNYVVIKHSYNGKLIILFIHI